jgi:hypothetical protein
VKRGFVGRGSGGDGGQCGVLVGGGCGGRFGMLVISSVKAEARPGWEARSMDRMETWSVVGVPAGV